MSQVLVILDSNTLSVVDWYFADSPIVPVTPGIRLEVPEGLAWDAVKGVQDGDQVTLVADSAKVQAKTDAAWAAIRSKRNRLLRDSDFTQMPDSPMSQEKKDAWAAYRQELRDLPDELTDPLTVEWPLDPTQQLPVPVAGSRLSGLLDAAL